MRGTTSPPGFRGVASALRTWCSSGAVSAAALVAAAAAGAVLAGCGGGGGTAYQPFEDAPTAWDKALKARPTDRESMVWAEGEVTGVSLDGSALDVRITRGSVKDGARIGVYVPMPRRPGAHYLKDESRELRVVEATVVAVAGDTCKAEVVNRTTNAPVAAGDKVIVRIP